MASKATKRAPINEGRDKSLRKQWKKVDLSHNLSYDPLKGIWVCICEMFNAQHVGEREHED